MAEPILVVLTAFEGLLLTFFYEQVNQGATVHAYSGVFQLSFMIVYFCYERVFHSWRRPPGDDGDCATSIRNLQPPGFAVHSWSLLAFDPLLFILTLCRGRGISLEDEAYATQLCVLLLLYPHVTSRDSQSACCLTVLADR
jgi:hypothetical protein